MPKYALLFIGDTSEHDHQPTPEELASDAKIGEWFADLGRKGILSSGEELQSAHAAKTRFPSGKPAVTDGPFMDAKEIVGGFAIVDMPDFDAAVALAKARPARSAVEVRPVVEHEEGGARCRSTC